MILFLKKGKRHLFEVELREHLVSKLIQKIYNEKVLLSWPRLASLNELD